MPAIYRVRQFLRATRAQIRPAPIDPELLERYLEPEAVALFQSMPVYDRQHALAVLVALRAAGYDERDLLAAALLHDVGKSRSGLTGIRLWHRVVTVLLGALWPTLLGRLGQDSPAGWRRPFYVQQNHASLGAELARQVGCSPVTVDLIRHHENGAGRQDDPLLAALQAADSAN